MSARPAGGWEPSPAESVPDQLVHWLEVDGRQACDPDVAAVDVEPASAFGLPSRHCPACADIVDEVRWRAGRLGFRLDVVLRRPGEQQRGDAARATP